MLLEVQRGPFVIRHGQARLDYDPLRAARGLLDGADRGIADPVGVDRLQLQRRLQYRILLNHLALSRGATGAALLVVFAVMWVFSLRFIRRTSKFELFYFTHLLYLAWLILAIVHAPVFALWAGVPIAGFVVEQIMRLSVRTPSTFVRSSQALRSGVTRLEIERRELRRKGALVSVEPQVFDLLVFLIRNRARVVSKDDLIAGVLDCRIVSESKIASRINAALTAIVGTTTYGLILGRSRDSWEMCRCGGAFTLEDGSGKPVTDAAITQTRLDMAPDGMATMTTAHVPLPSPEPGVYAFKAPLTMAGRWLLTISAKVPGEPDPVVGTGHRQAGHPVQPVQRSRDRWSRWQGRSFR